MIVTAQNFTVDFPEFSDAAKFPLPQVNLWLTAASNFVDEERWGDMAKIGVELCAAHHLAIFAQNVKAAAGGNAGALSGQVTSKSVDKVSVGYAENKGVIDGAGGWNLSTYGIQYLTFANMFGAGGIQL